MPCRDDRDNCGSDTVRIGKLQERLDEVTQNLCYVCGTAEMTALHILKGNKRLAKWWKEHQTADTRRVTESMNRFIISGMVTNANDVAEHFIATASREHPVSSFHNKWFGDLAVELVAEYVDAKTTHQNLASSINVKLSPDEILHIRQYGI